MVQDIWFHGIVYPYFMEQYKKNPEKAIDSLKDYIEMVKKDDFNGALQCLGIETDEKVIPKLVVFAKTRIDEMNKFERNSDSKDDDVK